MRIPLGLASFTAGVALLSTAFPTDHPPAFHYRSERFRLPPRPVHLLDPTDAHPARPCFFHRRSRSPLPRFSHRSPACIPLPIGTLSPSPAAGPFVRPH